MRRLSRMVLVACGTLSVGLGIVGIFVPLLPTTPLLLLAAFCYSRGSKRLHRWLMGNRVFGRYIRDYRSGRGISRGHKAVTLTLLWLAIGYAATFVASTVWLRILLLLVAVGVTLHILTVRTSRRKTESREGEGSGRKG